MVKLGQTQKLNGSWVEIHKTTFNGAVGFIVQNGSGGVWTFTDYNEAFDKYMKEAAE